MLVDILLKEHTREREMGGIFLRWLPFFSLPCVHLIRIDQKEVKHSEVVTAGVAD